MMNIIAGLSKGLSGFSFTAPPAGTVPLYIFAGQSNMGRSTVEEMSGPEAAIYDKTYTNIYIHNVVAGTTGPEQMVAGVNTMCGNPDEFGPELSFFESFAGGDKRYVVKAGYGGTSLATFWSPSNTEGYVYLQNLVNTMLSHIFSSGETPFVEAFIWMQGEEDATNEAWADAYLDNLTNFFATFKTWLDGRLTSLGFPSPQDFKKIIGRINGIEDTAEVYRLTVRGAQADYCAIGGNNAVLVDTDGYSLKDGVHYTATGQIQFGQDCYGALYD